MDRPPNDSQLRDYLCKLEQPMRIPRPKCSGMQYVQTSGRQGFYLSLRRKEPTSKSTTPLSALFQPMMTSNSEITSSTDGQQQQQPQQVRVKDDAAQFEQRLTQATSNLSIGNGRSHPSSIHHHHVIMEQKKVSA